MENSGNKRKQQLSCMEHGPGPIYKLGSLTGYINHDPSRRREPAYTIKFSNKITHSADGPGPRYDVQNYTRRGPKTSPAFTIGKVKFDKVLDTGPSPFEYQAEKCLTKYIRRPPAYSLQFKDHKKIQSDSPGPIYSLPTCLGPHLVDKKAHGAFTISGLHNKDHLNDQPGPGAYKTENYDVIKRRCPAYSLKSRPNNINEWTGGPGPKYKSEFNTGKNPPKYSFGIRHSQCAGTPMTEADEDF